MKALLEYNGFTRVINIPRFRPEIKLPITKPFNTMILPDELEPKDSNGYWRFTYRRHLTEDLAVYEFEDTK